MKEAPKKIWTDPLFWHSVGGTYTDHGVEIQKTPLEFLLGRRYE